MPSQPSNISKASSAYRPRNIVAYGELLGTGVATRLALQRPVKALVLEAPFTSVVDVGSQVWWFLPLRLVMTDQYRTIDRIGSVTVPLLILHGARDSMIPVAQARQVYAAANEPKQLAILRQGDHNNLFDHGAWQKVEAFLVPGSRCGAGGLRPVYVEQVALAS